MDKYAIGNCCYQALSIPKQKKLGEQKFSKLFFV